MSVNALTLLKTQSHRIDGFVMIVNIQTYSVFSFSIPLKDCFPSVFIPFLLAFLEMRKSFL